MKNYFIILNILFSTILISQQSENTQVELSDEGKKLERLLVGDWVPEDLPDDAIFMFSIKQNGVLVIQEEERFDTIFWYLTEDSENFIFVLGVDDERCENSTECLEKSMIVLTNDDQFELTDEYSTDIWRRKKNPVNLRNLVKKEGIYYTKDTNKPYSGPYVLGSVGGDVPKFEGNIKEGLMDGSYISRNDVGQKIGEGIYENGVQLIYTVTAYHENGHHSSKANYNKNGKLEGIATEWYNTGQKKGEWTYKDGVRHGPLTLWYRDGTLEQRKNYENGEEIPVVFEQTTDWIYGGAPENEIEESIDDHSINGSYTYEDNDGKITVVITGNIWQAKMIRKSGFGASYDEQNADYANGVVKDNDLYDNSGYMKLGSVSLGNVNYLEYTLYKE